MFGEVLFGEIAQDEVDCRRIDACFDIGRVDKTFAIGRRFGRKSVFGKPFDKFRDEFYCVDHLAACVPRVRVDAEERDRHGVGAERFGIEHAARRRVDGIGAISIEFGDIEINRAAADFFVGGKADADVSVRNFGVIDEIGHGRHNGSHARLVVGAKERCPRSGDDIVPDLFGKLGVVGEFYDDIVAIGQDNIRALVVFVDNGFDVCAADFGRSIDMRNETYGFDVAIDV